MFYCNFSHNSCVWCSSCSHFLVKTKLPSKLRFENDHRGRFLNSSKVKMPYFHLNSLTKFSQLNLFTYRLTLDFFRRSANQIQSHRSNITSIFICNHCFQSLFNTCGFFFISLVRYYMVGLLTMPGRQRRSEPKPLLVCDGTTCYSGGGG